jgi:hypothetical protein
MSNQCVSMLISYIITMMFIGMGISLGLGASIYDAMSVGLVVTIALPATAFMIYQMCITELLYD